MQRAYTHKNQIFRCDSTQSQNVTHVLERNFRKNRKYFVQQSIPSKLVAGVAAGVVGVLPLMQPRCRSHLRCRIRSGVMKMEIA